MSARVYLLADSANNDDECSRLALHIGAAEAQDCWPWTGARSPLGYGRTHIYIEGVRKSRNAHQAVWVALHGHIPSGMCVLHRCDNRACCNPEHLFLGSQADNTADRHAKRRDARGAANTKARFTAEQAASVRRFHSNGVPAAVIARRFGVASSSIDRIVRGKNHRLDSGGAS